MGQAPVTHPQVGVSTDPAGHLSLAVQLHASPVASIFQHASEARGGEGPNVLARTGIFIKDLSSPTGRPTTSAFGGIDIARGTDALTGRVV